jgi:hypothetical protein
MKSVLSRMTFYALEHRDVAEIHGVSKWLVSLMAGFAFAIGEAAEVDGMLN